MHEIEIVKPGEIEGRSFDLITEELDRCGIVLPEDQRPVTMRVIHTTADFDYTDTLVYTEHAVEKARALLAAGADIVTDTNMALAGINKKVLAACGGEAHCYMAEEQVAKLAKERGVTRASVSMELASQRNKPVIFAVGNAPTALVSLYDLIQEEKVKPELIIGVPVGFVNVVQSKELIMSADVPYIVARGRKGGSNIAACIVNALLYMIDNDRYYWTDKKI